MKKARIFAQTTQNISGMHVATRNWATTVFSVTDIDATSGVALQKRYAKICRS